MTERFSKQKLVSRRCLVFKEFTEIIRRDHGSGVHFLHTDKIEFNEQVFDLEFIKDTISVTPELAGYLHLRDVLAYLLIEVLKDLEDPLRAEKSHLRCRGSVISKSSTYSLCTLVPR